jgi:hypothetical protein
LGTTEYPRAPLAPCGLVGIAILVPLIQQDKLSRAFLISQQAVLYRTRGGTCCPRVSTPMIRSLAFEHDNPHHLTESNCLHHSKPCSNHSIDPHYGQITSRRMGDHLSQRHMPNSTSYKMEDLYNTHDYRAKQIY